MAGPGGSAPGPAARGAAPGARGFVAPWAGSGQGWTRGSRKRRVGFGSRALPAALCDALRRPPEARECFQQAARAPRLPWCCALPVATLCTKREQGHGSVLPEVPQAPAASPRCRLPLAASPGGQQGARGAERDEDRAGSRSGHRSQTCPWDAAAEGRRAVPGAGQRYPAVTVPGGTSPSPP